MTPTTTTATARKIRHHSTPALALALKSADIGRAILDDGREVWITWGRSLTRHEAEWFADRSTFTPIRIGDCPSEGSEGGLRENYELMLPDDEVANLQLIEHQIGNWIPCEPQRD